MIYQSDDTFCIVLVNQVAGFLLTQEGIIYQKK